MSVSIIIPARNEEANIERVVRSAALQPDALEILVVDDQSQDRTGEILARLAEEIPLLKTIRVDSLPAGWLGKNYALATASRAARGEWFLFTDADTEHRPGSLAALLARAQNADLLSLSPGQVTECWWEKSITPLIYSRLARLYKFDEVSDPQSPAAAANGQYLLIRREAYQRAGGHEAVRSEILEDVELARRVKASGGKLVFLPGAEWVQTRMYSTFGSMWDGWTKNLFLLYGRETRAIVAALAEALLLDVAPFLLFVTAFVAAIFAVPTLLPAAVGFLFVVLWRRSRYQKEIEAAGFESSLGIYLPVGAALFVLLLINSARAHRRGSVRWKGRAIETRQRNTEPS